MKSKLFVMVLCLAVLFGATGCKRGVSGFVGKYSYKTSGSVVLTSSGEESVVVLPDRIGSLDIIDVKGDDGDEVLLVFSEVGGGIRYVDGRVDGDEIRLSPYNWKANVSEVGQLDVTVSGSGKLYDDVIVFKEHYDGSYSAASGDGRLYGDEIKTVAERN